MKKSKNPHIRIFLSVILVVILAAFVSGEDKLPIPTYENSVIISIEHRVTDSAEVEYIKNNIDFGLYTWLSFSKTAYVPSLAWHSDWTQAGQGIQSFKDTIDRDIQAALNQEVKLHVVLVAGLVRYVYIYREAKEEDIRNAQWYNDNKLASDSQILDPDAMDSTIWGTLSRYARKMRANLEAKGQASVVYLKDQMDQNPGLITAVSGWGEVELNFNRINHKQSIQDYFCDYSPFAVLEFRDWVRHTGMYDDVNGKYKGEGYSGGGDKYRGANGLQQFNQDFGTAFSTWDLKYFHWSLNDDYDTDPTDYVNNDPNRIPYADYSHGNMMPDSGPDYIAGGFDPPRVMNPGNAFWDLWNLFRETMVQNFVKDMVQWAHDAGIPAERWYSHQIPADYLFGTNPDMDNKNPRYYTSASPLWSADVQPYGSTGATIYDIKFPPEVHPNEFVRTTKYGVPAVSSMDDNWAIMEYDAETYPPGMTVEESPVADILEQHFLVYDYNCHLINFFRWWDSGEHRIKGMNKETALKDFVEAIRDKARKTNLSYVFEPPGIAAISGQFNGSSGAVEIEINPEIWSGHDWEWKDWGDFDYFEIHRSTDPGFTPSSSTLIGTTPDYLYQDTSYAPQMAYYYRARAVNVNGAGGAYSEEVMIIPSATDVAVLAVNRSELLFGARRGGCATSPEAVAVINTGDEGTDISWTAAASAGWITVSPSSGSGEGWLSIGIDHAGLGTGTYTGEVAVSDPAAFNSPQTIQVTLNVYDASGDDEPFGVFDTPLEGATVFGNIPVTGWALDEIEVTLVEIKRDPHPDDPSVVIGPDGLVYIGDAVFVMGARPDVEAAYPDYPKADRAGWGYMMLTNFLPNGGNGTFTLYAIAYDGSGHRVELGKKTITCDNANAIKPFGTIDTPAQGGVVSGEDYVNFGWALTPQPKHIPIDGSTMWVWVDGLPLDHPVYNNYREDIATLFPGYANSAGAVGYYYLDTTAFENGVHNIAWSVEDSDGVTSGIGSRYFNIFNASSSGTQSQTQDDDLPRTGVFSVMSKDLSGAFPSIRPVYVKKGYNLREHPQKVYPDENGVVEIEIREVERLALSLDSDPSSLSFESMRLRSNQLTGDSDYEFHPLTRGSECSYTGYLMFQDQLRPLPIGSTLDRSTGVFAWQPGPGFLGEYELVFIRERSAGGKEKIRIRVKIHPRF